MTIENGRNGPEKVWSPLSLCKKHLKKDILTKKKVRINGETMKKTAKKIPKTSPINPDKMSRGHAFGRVGKGRSTSFRSKKEYRRKDKKNNKGV